MAYAQYKLLLGDDVKGLEVIESAALPGSRSDRVGLSQVMVAAAIGLLLAVGAAFLIEYMDDTLKSPDDISRSVGLSTLGAITRITGASPSERLVAARHPKSPSPRRTG